jgi:hypothetical protein
MCSHCRPSRSASLDSAPYTRRLDFESRTSTHKSSLQPLQISQAHSLPCQVQRQRQLLFAQADHQSHLACQERRQRTYTGVMLLHQGAAPACVQLPQEGRRARATRAHRRRQPGQHACSGPTCLAFRTRQEYRCAHVPPIWPLICLGDLHAPSARSCTPSTMRHGAPGKVHS